MNSVRLRSVSRVLPIVLVVASVVAGILLVVSGDGSPSEPIDPVAVEAVGPVFDTVDDMAEASDLVVDATVVGVESGRVVTDPDDPDGGIRTRLVELELESTLAGDAPDRVIVEQEASLLDGTPIVVNGVDPFAIGDHAIWFLVADPSGETDFFAVINDQGRVPVP